MNNIVFQLIVSIVCVLGSFALIISGMLYSLRRKRREKAIMKLHACIVAGDLTAPVFDAEIGESARESIRAAREKLK